ncbi:GDNF-inducible zinc finger protein 1 [Fasciola hepatica]|uniref:GDNF-inducible zinc finger protein 1 n=1 Tax=Fasciola hepatica TaxID=6192 RepID=A0A4E0RJ35_FASHE|nr:GDNF-inducible zinc finger protein 1 [Fasciola hepatica]
MSTVANAALSAPGPILINSQSIPNSADKVEENAPKVIAAKVSDSESDSDSETSTEDEDTSDDERMADNPILKERLKQLDRYATPLSHKTQSPDQAALSGAYATPLPLTDCMVNSAPLSSHGKSSGPSDVVDSSSTPSEYRSHQPSVTESPNPCSGPASVTPKHNFSPPYGIHGGASGPSSQHDQHSSATFYSHLSSKFSRKSNDGPACGYRNSFPEGCETGVPDNQIGVGEGGQEFICDVCNAVYANVASLRSHMKKHNYIAKRHQCEHCPYSTQYGKNLLKHIESMHEKGQTDQFQCEGCARFFPTEDHLRDHECASLQFNAYRCEECGRVFKTKLRLKYHADIHNPRKPYVCDVEGCDRAFRTPKYLKNHRDEFHRMQPKNYLCPVEGCDLVFHRKTHLKRHIATHEDSEKKYHCQWPSCQRRFCSEETLNLHYRKHTGEKPFNCALCTYTCYNKPTLNEHYRLNHAKDSTVEGPYKSFNPPTSSPSCGAQHTSANTYDFGSRKDEESSNVRSSTPAALPTVRHRMADILESCGTQPPGPLDAEINGILDSLDKESDLPDLFTSSNFDFESTAPDATYRNGSHATGPNPPPAAYEHPTISSSSHETRYPSTLSPAVSGDQPRVISSLEATLAGILADFQKADLNNSIEAFEEAKSRALSVLPTFTTGNTLDQQLTAILENVLESFVGQPPQVLRAVFQAAHSFTREECYMIESLEHQLMDDSPLIAPTPPRRRGRRPKLQQQLQPFLQRVFDLEPGTAEAMAAHLVTSAQQERNVSFCHQFSATECIRGRGRGRGYRIRGRPGRPLSLTLKLFPDGTASRTQHELIGYRRVAGGSVLRGSGISRRMRGGVRGRYKIDRLSGTPGNRFQHSSPMGENSREARSPVDNLPAEPHSSHPEHQRSFDEPHGFDMEDQELGYIQHPHGDRFDSDTPVQSEEIDATSMRLREIRKLSGESDEELDDLDDTDEGVDDEAGEAYEEKDLSQHAQTDQPDTAVRRSTALDVAELSKVVSQKSSLYNTSDKGSVNQDTLGEMLEDLGVIVKRIGERAAARRQPCAQESPPIYPTQPLNLAELPEDEQPADCSVASLLLNGSKLTRNRTDSSAPAIQLPSMAILASASVGTPTSVGEGSTPGCSANVEPQEASPHFSATHSQQPTPTAGPYGPVQSHTPVMSAPSDNQTASSCTGTHPTVLSCTPLRGEFKASQSDYHHRSVPMWSCESMCCPTTRENCSVGPDKSAYSRSPSYDGGSVHRMSVPCSVEDSADTGQSYHPTDLSTRMVVGGYDSQSIPSPQASPSSPKHQQPGSVNPVCGVDTNGMVNKSGLLPPYPGSVSSTTTAMDSLRSAVEAVDHLRSLSALGAKYTASLGMSDDPAQSQSYHHSLRLPVCPYTSRSTQQDESPQPGSVGRPDPGPSPTPPPHGSVHSSGPNIFTPPHIPSALNNLLSRDQKNETMINSPLGLSTGGANGHCVSPSKGDFPVQTVSLTAITRIINGRVVICVSFYHTV